MLVAAALMLFSALPRSRRWRDALAPLAVCAGMAASFHSVNGSWPAWPATSATAWLFYFAPAAGAVAAVGALLKRKSIAIALATLLSALAAALMLQSRWQTELPSVMFTSLIAAIGATCWMLLLCTSDALAQRWQAPLTLTMLCGFFAMLLMMSGTILYGRLALALAAALLLVAVIVCVTKRSGMPFLFTPVIALLAGLLTAGYFFAEVTKPTAILLLLAPLPLAACRMPWIVRRKSLSKIVLWLIMAALLPGVAAALAVPEFMRTLSEEVSPYSQ